MRNTVATVLSTALLGAGLNLSVAFTARSNTFREASRLTKLNDISEWRDLMFDDIVLPIDEIDESRKDEGPLREVCVLPFPFSDVLLQGETKELRLYEDRFIKLFDDAMENHAGVVAMGLLASTGVIQSVPLCEIEAYNRMEGFGIFVTIRMVGRAALLTLSQEEPYMKAVCCEKIDSMPPNLELPNVVASNIENMMVTLSSMEYQMKQQNLYTIDDETNTLSPGMKLRMMEAELEEEQLNDDDDDSDSDDDSDDEYDLDRSARFRHAFETAKATDMQGYMLSASPGKFERGAQDLTALSWAAFCTEEDTLTTAMYRIRALDCEDLFERLKSALVMLKERKVHLQTAMKKAGIKYDSNKDIGEEDTI